jgi:monoamine oxidase
MAACELARAGARVTVVEARNRCGGRIYPLASEKFGYPAEGGAEFVHGDAPLTRALAQDAGLSFEPRIGARWKMRAGEVLTRDRSARLEDQFRRALAEVREDLPIADFLEQHLSGRQHESLRQNILRMVQGYDLADPQRVSTWAIRDEWLPRGDRKNDRIEGGYGRLIEHLVTQCRGYDADIRLGLPVRAIEESGDRLVARCGTGTGIDADAVVLSVPLPILSEIALPAVLGRRLEAARDIGFGSVVKILLGFRRMWWADRGGHDLADLSFLHTDTPVPTWWTQFPAPHAVMTGWYPQSTAERAAPLSEGEFINLALRSLADTFGVPVEEIKSELTASQAINWKADPFSRGAYSYATPRTPDAQVLLSQPAGSAIFFCGEALYSGPDMGTVEAALASGQAAARTILSMRPIRA